MWALNRRRIMNAAIGAIGGLLTGLGLAVTVSQGGRINPAESETIAGIACAILIGAALGAADLGKWGKRALVVVTLSLPLLSPAATAQQAPRCTDVASVAVTAFIGEEPVVVDVAGATESEPLELDLTRLDGLGFAVELTDPTLQGSFTLEVAEVRPFGFLGGTGLVYHGPVDQGLAKGNIEIRGTWPLQVTAGKSTATISEVPLGRLRLDATVRDAAASADSSGDLNAGALCEQQVWIRLGSSPFGHPLGLVALAMQALGALAISAAGWRSAKADATPDNEPTDVPPAGDGQVQITTSEGTAVDLRRALEPGAGYMLKLSPGIELRDRTKDPAVAAVTAAGLDADELVVDLTVGGGFLHFGIPFRTLRPGRSRLEVDLLEGGSLRRRERVDLTVRHRFGLRRSRPVTHTTELDVPGLEPTAAVRDAVVILHGAGRRIGRRAFAATGHRLTPHARLNGRRLGAAATDAHAALAAALASPDDEALAELARAGRSLHDVLFPGPELFDGVAGPGSVLQVVTGATVAPVPWTLLYDVEAASARRTCPSFATHLPEACPAADDPAVACPQRFWGLRYLVEAAPVRQPESATLQHVDGRPVELAAMLAGDEGHLAAELARSIQRSAAQGEPLGEALRLAGGEVLAATGAPIGLAYRVAGRPDRAPVLVAP